MSDAAIRKRLNEIDIQAYLREQRKAGRSALTPTFREDWARVHAMADEILRNPARGSTVRRIAEVVEISTRSVANLATNPKPRYYSYTDVHVLDWFMHSHRETFRAVRTRAATGICLLLRDFARFESDTIVGVQKLHRGRVDLEKIKQRLDLLTRAYGEAESALAELQGVEEVKLPDTHQYGSAEEFAFDESRASGLVNLTCLPQSPFHDEVAFLRTIHVSELCFMALRMAFVQVIENEGNESQQLQALQDALRFAATLHHMFKVLRTMSPEHFKDFRDYTGDASAVQSRNYQLMDIHFRGLDPRKLSHMQKDPLLQDLHHFVHPGFVHMAQVLRRNDTASETVIAAARQLDHQLLSWRGLHLAFAKAYLEPAQIGTGATSGAAYLEQFLKSGAFAETELDVGVIEALFKDIPEIPQQFRKVSAKMGIAPPHMRTPPNATDSN